MVPIGTIEAKHIVHSTSPQRSSDDIPNDDIERAASQVPPPRASVNFMAPVNDVCEDNFHLMNADMLGEVSRRPQTDDAKNGQWSMFDVSLSYITFDQGLSKKYNLIVIHQITVLVCSPWGVAEDAANECMMPCACCMDQRRLRLRPCKVFPYFLGLSVLLQHAHCFSWVSGSGHASEGCIMISICCRLIDR